MGHLANGNLGMEGSGKRFFENGGGGVDMPRFKKRRVSAIREFPPGCGRFAAPVNGKLKEVENLGVESNSVRQEENLAEVKTSYVDESSQVPESARCENGCTLEDLAQGEEGRKVTNNTVEPMDVDRLSPELPVETVQAEALNQKETSSANNVAKESMEKKFPPRRKTSAIRDLGQAKAAKFTTGLEPMSPVEAEKPVQEDVSDEDQKMSADSENVVVKSMMNKFPPRRKTSAIREFPLGCGRDAAPVNLKQVPKSVEQGVKADAKQLEERVQPGVASDSKMKEKNDAVAGVQVKPVVADNKGTGQRIYVRERVKQVPTEKAGVKPPTKVGTGSGTSAAKQVQTEKAGIKPPAKIDTGSGTSVVKQVQTEKAGIKPPTKIDTGSGNSAGRQVQTEKAGIRPPTKIEKGSGNSVGKQVLSEKTSVKAPTRIDKGSGKSVMKQVQTEKVGIKPTTNMDKGSGKSGVNLGTESVRLSKGTSIKKSSSQKSTNRHDPVHLLSFDDREIVQSLMAKPNCPWGQGKKTPTPASVGRSPVERKKIFKTPISIQFEDDQGEKASKSASANQSSRVEHTDLESLDDREIVQSLMAAPNCPWRSGKKPFKYPGGQAKKFVR